MSEDSAKALSDKLLAAIGAIDGWASRRDIAKQMGKNYLNPADVLMLDMLVSSGQIEAQKNDRPGIINYTFKYRIKQETK